jgi:hypothetical protein
MKTIEILERVRIISPIVEPLYTRNLTNCAGRWISSDVDIENLSVFLKSKKEIV